jgi:hypothetical protein
MFDFVIVGAQKCATTSLYEYLRRCESVAVPEIKEIPYFTDENLFGDKDKFDFYFEKDFISSNKVKGFAYVNLCYYYEKFHRVSEKNKNIKIIYVVRDRRDRAYSAYKYAITRGWEQEFDVSKALEKNRVNSFSEYWQFSNLTYVDHSLYGTQIEGLLKFIDKKNVLIVDFEKLKSDPEYVLGKVLDFVGADSENARRVEYKVYNKESGIRSSGLQKIVMLDNPVKKLYQAVIPSSVRGFVNKKLVRRLEEWNRSGENSNKNKIDKAAFYRELERYSSDFELDRNKLLLSDYNVVGFEKNDLYY